MFALRSGRTLALFVGASLTMAVACSGGLPQRNTGNSGKGGSGQAGAGPSNDVPGLGGQHSSEGGAAPFGGGGGAAGVGAEGARGGEKGAQGGNQAGGSCGSGIAQCGGSSGGGPDADLFPLGPPSSDCEAGPAVALPGPHAAGLYLPPTSGHECDDTFEPNDTDGEACRLTLGTQVGTRLSTPNDKVDKFVFHAEAAVTYTLILSTLKCKGSSSLDAMQVTVTSLGATGSATQLSALSYFGQQDSLTIPASNTTADEVITITGSTSCEYEFQLVQSTAEGLVHGADSEPNGTPSTAQPIEENRSVSSRLSSPSDPRDYFVLSVQPNLTYSITVSTQGCSGSSSLDNVAVQGQSVNTGDPVTNLNLTAYLGGVFHAEFATRTAGEELLMFTTSQSCEYEFYVIPSTVCGLGHDKVSYEPNDTPSTAAPIVLGQTIRAEVQAQDATDYYTFAVEPYAQYALTLSAASCHGSSSLDGLTAALWSGRTMEVAKGSKVFYFGDGNETLAFTAGSASQQLLAITSGLTCGYDFSISKD